MTDSQTVKEQIRMVEEEQLATTKHGKRVMLEEEEELEMTTRELRFIHEKQHRWRNDPQMLQLLSEEESILQKRCQKQKQFLEDWAEKVSMVKKGFSEKEESLRKEWLATLRNVEKEEADGTDC